MRKLMLVPMLMIAACSSQSSATVPANVSVPEQAVAEEQLTPTGCGPSKDTVTDLLDHGYTAVLKGYDNDNNGIVMFRRDRDQNVVILNFKNDQKSCIVLAINGVKDMK